MHVQASFNNTIVTFTDPIGNVLAWSSSGSLGFPRIAQGHAVRRAAGFADRRQQSQGIRAARGGSSCQRSGRGPRIGRARTVDRGIEVRAIKDVTPIPHNGCRPPKKRRV